MRAFFFIAIVLFSSCKSKKALPHETSLFPEEGKNKIWLMNSVATQSDGKESHLCALLTLDHSSGKPAVNYYTSYLDVHDSAFAFGRFYSENAIINAEKEFPFFVSVSGGDSVTTEKSILLERNKLRLATELKDEDPKRGEAMKFRMKFKDKNSIRFLSHDSQFGIMTAGPIKSRLRMTGGIRKNSNDVFITTISKPDQLLQLEKESSLVWVNMILENKETYSLLFKIKEDNSVELLGYPSASVRYPLVKLFLTSYKSPASGNVYYLNFKLQIPGRAGEYEVWSTIDNQELSMKKSSFWMGGINVFESATKKKIGIGNMYNFSNKTIE